MARRNRTVGFLVAAALAALGGSPTATASPAMPRPLERKIADADAVVIATLLTRPRHTGDAYDVHVDECVKGTASGTIRVTAANYFRGCCPPPGGWTPADALEKDAPRAVLFLEPIADGVRVSRDPVLLSEGATTSAWFYDVRPAALAPEAVRTLAALDRDEDAARGAERWAAGIEGENALLVTALLHRSDFVATGGDGGWGLGTETTARARAQWEAGRGRLLTAIAARAESSDGYVRLFALRTAGGAEAFSAAPTEAEARARPRFVAAATRALRANGDEGEVRAALAVLAALGDAAVAERIVERVPEASLSDLPDLGRHGAVLVKRFPITGRTFATAATAQLDRPDGLARAVAFASALAGRRLETADEIRRWAAATAR